MSKVVFLKLETGDFNQGFKVTLDIAEQGSYPYIIGVSGYLRQAPEIPKFYQDWQTRYCNLESAYRRTRLHAIEEDIADREGDREISLRECREAAEKLKASFQNWLNCDEFRPIERELLAALNNSDEIKILLQTENEQLRKLPWEEWNFFRKFPNAELGIIPLSSYRQRELAVSNKVKILAILGNSDGIDTQEDKKILENLPYADTCFLVEPTREQFARLWEDCWDILFFAGHSSSQDGEKGYIYINRTDNLEISELEKTLRTAVSNGLKLAIFNSCDGLGLARQLEKLHVPQVIVMREPIPDKFAQEFLKYFLTNFSRGMTLYASAQCAKSMLRELLQIDRKFPGASWLPIICQNPAAKDFVWPLPQPKTGWWRSRANRFVQHSQVAVISGFAGAAIVLVAVRMFGVNSLSCLATEKSEAGVCVKDLSKTPLIIGFLTSPHNPEPTDVSYHFYIIKYLKTKLAKQVKDVIIKFDNNSSYHETKNKIVNKEWDIIFAHSPMNSWVAKNNGYTWIGRKYPNSAVYYRSVLFVKASSPIKSIADIKRTTVVALGYVGSASSFYVPAYDLYGKSLSANVGNTHGKIKELVKTGKADVGASIKSEIENQPDLRIIHESRAIPNAGVFISPKLLESNRNLIKQMLLQAPKEIKEKANYGESAEINYEYMGQISLKAEEVISCADFNKNPVQFFCKK